MSDALYAALHGQAGEQAAREIAGMGKLFVGQELTDTNDAIRQNMAKVILGEAGYEIKLVQGKKPKPSVGSYDVIEGPLEGTVKEGEES